MQEFERFNLRIKNVRQLLTNPEITSVRLVTNPEKMVISETMRAYTYLSLYNLTVEALIVNRVYRKNAPESSTAKLKEQENYIETIESAFQPMKIFYSRLFPHEVVGMEAVKKLGDELFGSDDPSVIYARENPMKIISRKGNTSIQLRVPFVSASELELYTTRDTIIVGIGQYRRTIALPLGLYGREIASAEISDGILTVKFREDEDGGRKKERGLRRKGKGND
jgi:arsenite-transporting ATPase